MRIDADREDAHWVRVRQITALGEPLLELQPAGGEIRLAFGGDVANSLVCLARILGAGGPERSLVSALGDSGYSEWLRERLCREGIRLREPPLAGEPGLYGLPLDPVRRPGFSYWRAGSAASEFLRSAVARRLGGHRAECVIRGGAAGCWVGSGERWRHIPTVPVHALDTAGAGDSHLAGYLAARIRGCARAESAAYANQVAALIVGQRGSAPREGLTFPPLPAQTSGSTS